MYTIFHRKISQFVRSVKITVFISKFIKTNDCLHRQNGKERNFYEIPWKTIRFEFPTFQY